MSVCDITTLTETAVPVYNTNGSVTQSAQVESVWRGKHGIPAGNRYGDDLGADTVLAYTSEAAVFDFLSDLADHCDTVGATGCYAVAGCPQSVELLSADLTAGGAEDGLVYDFAHLIANCKAIRDLGYLPRLVDDLTGGQYLMKKASALGWDIAPGYSEFYPAFSARVTEHPTALEAYNDTDYDAAIAYAVGEGQSQGSGTTNQFLRYQSSFSQSGFAAFSRLLGGWVGYYTSDSATHPTYDQCRFILGRAANSQGKLSALTARKVLVGVNVLGGSGTTAIGKAARCALIGKKFVDLGYDVTYWCDDTSDKASNYLLPWSGSYSNWSHTTLDAATATGAIEYDIAIGWAFKNGSEALWSANISPSANGLFIGGQSGNGAWGLQNQIDGGHSAIVQQIERGGTHAGTQTTLARQADAVLALIAGKTLAEAAWLGRGGTLLAIGDPLCRPFQV